ncbi:YbfB/YjiJ family MFS transporter [Dongia soli]|uniref:YbfB/YjiJ family MFS transporter n=1 Tax=Dongia soli TaxID=600628 RepID=A0ABU5EGZ9_9PROT|nr:YbfB/YjiJ family MFS transporter [Dongia soli]MDY0885617.1 YbfB/YjiJ family MFS transporter [Dongia soli]
MAIAGFCASLVGIGLARFAYTPLLPAIIQADWFTAPQASYLGAANLIGYLLGAMAAGGFAHRRGTATFLRLMMATATISVFACAWPVSFSWFFAWRLLAGIAGGALMVLAAPVILRRVEARQTGMVTGAIFTGIGVGIAISGTLMPLLLQYGLTASWLGLGAVAILLTLMAWRGWPSDDTALAASQAAAPSSASLSSARSRPVLIFSLQYGLNAVGLVPHMIFLVDFIARSLGRGVEIGAVYWVLFGLSAMLGPILAGLAADRYGARATLRVAYVLQAFAVAALLITDDPVCLGVSACIMGALTPGVVPLALARLKELLHDPVVRHRAWSGATATFAVGQAAAAYGFTVLLAQSGSYTPVFAVAAISLVIAFGLDLMVRSRT